MNTLSTIQYQITSHYNTHLIKDPQHTILRANPFPKIMDLFCRLPLPTLHYEPEANNLGDLMRLLVRPGTQINYNFSISRTVESTPNI